MNRATKISQRLTKYILITTMLILMMGSSSRLVSALQVFQPSRCSPLQNSYNSIRLSTKLRSSSSSSSSDVQSSNANSNNNINPQSEPPQRYLQEGLLAVSKPLNWTSQDVVGYLRKMLERDARQRGCIDDRKKKRNPWMKVGHGGTLDPLATGVLVVGVGKKGTSQLQQYLTGTKGYRAGVTLGIQTTTLDLDPTGHVVEEKPFSHVTLEAVEEVIPQFTGTIQQVPPVFSALKKDGKRLYELGRQGKTAEDVKIEPREVNIYRLEVLPTNDEGKGLPSCFGLDVECGGGTYIRSLIRDIGISLDTVATMSGLERTKQGVFLPEHCLHQDDWTPENIYNSIEKSRELLDQHDAALLLGDPDE